MKKIILLIGILFGLVACNPYMRSEYVISIEYTIDGGDSKIERVENIKMDMPTSYTPIYSYDGQTLMIFGAKTGYASCERQIVYSGSLPVKVSSFEWKRVKTYRASRWDGHELKR